MPLEHPPRYCYSGARNHVTAPQHLPTLQHLPPIHSICPQMRTQPPKPPLSRPRGSLSPALSSPQGSHAPSTHPEDFSGLGGSARGFPLKPGILQDLERCTWGSLAGVALLSPAGDPSSTERFRPLSLAWVQQSEVRGGTLCSAPSTSSHRLLPIAPHTAHL